MNLPSTARFILSLPIYFGKYATTNSKVRLGSETLVRGTEFREKPHMIGHTVRRAHIFS